MSLPVMVPVVSSPFTVMLWAPAARVTVLLKMRPFPAFARASMVDGEPKVKSPATFTKFAMVRTVLSLMTATPLASERAPVPIGPAVTTPLVGVELAAKMRLP